MKYIQISCENGKTNGTNIESYRKNHVEDQIYIYIFIYIFLYTPPLSPSMMFFSRWWRSPTWVQEAVRRSNTKSALHSGSIYNIRGEYYLVIIFLAGMYRHVSDVSLLSDITVRISVLPIQHVFNKGASMDARKWTVKARVHAEISTDGKE